MSCASGGHFVSAAARGSGTVISLPEHAVPVGNDCQVVGVEYAWVVRGTVECLGGAGEEWWAEQCCLYPQGRYRQQGVMLLSSFPPPKQCSWCRSKVTHWLNGHLPQDVGSSNISMTGPHRGCSTLYWQRGVGVIQDCAAEDVQVQNTPPRCHLVVKAK